MEAIDLLGTRGHRNESAALVAMVQLLGAEGVVVEPEALTRWGATCGGRNCAPLAVVLPRTAEDVQQIVRVATQTRVPIYSVSTGLNWGYGGSAPIAERSLIVSLQRLNRIIEFDEDLAYVVLEPGVTQQQLRDFLQQRGSACTFDVTGASPHASIVGNILERGFGLSPYGDRFACCAGMEVVLADGTTVQTGLRRFSAARSGSLYRWGLGPYLDGIFTQSNFGIVTKLGVWLMPKAEATIRVLMRFPDDEGLARAIPALRSLRLRGVLTSPVHVANDIRVVSAMESYPYQEVEGVTPLPDHAVTALRRRWGIGAWNVITAVWGSRRQVQAAVQEIRRTVAGHCAVRCIGDRSLRWLRWLTPHLPSRMRQQMALRQELLGLLDGVPTAVPLRGMYWRKHTLPENGHYEPVRDRCGLLWLSPIVPLVPLEVHRFMQLTRETMAIYRFEMNVTISLLAERAACCTTGIVFDEAVYEEAERARACYAQLLHSYIEAGFIPYRLGTQTQNHPLLFPEGDSFVEACSRIKRSLDPAGILSPGRYGIGRGMHS